MVGYVKGHFFVRYREFESWAHLNQTAERWLAEEADLRLHGTVAEVVAERFTREILHLRPLPPTRYDTAYNERRNVSWDAYIEVRGNRYSVPSELTGQIVAVRIGLDGSLRVYRDDDLVTSHLLQPSTDGWVTVPEHHTLLWDQALGVTRRDLAVYEEASRWS
jgi:hypothetical protein